MIFQLSDWLPKPMIWVIIVRFDQIRKNWWKFSCAEILEVGKKIFAASSVKKMSRFEEVSPEEIKRIVDNATPIDTKRSTKYGLKIFIGKCVLNAIKYLSTTFATFVTFVIVNCQGITNIIFTVFQSGWTVLEEKILKINRGNVEARAQWLSEILLHLGEKARWLLL